MSRPAVASVLFVLMLLPSAMPVGAPATDAPRWLHDAAPAVDPLSSAASPSTAAASEEPAPTSAWQTRLFSFDGTDDGFARTREAPRSHVNVDLQRGAVHLYSDRSDPHDEILMRALPEPLDATRHDFQVSLDFAPDRTYSQQGFLLFLGPANVSDVGGDPGVLSVRFEEFPDVERDPYYQFYDGREYVSVLRNVTGVERFRGALTFGYEVAWCQYPPHACRSDTWYNESGNTLTIDYNATRRALRVSMPTLITYGDGSSETVTFWDETTLGDAAGDTFRFESIGVASDGIGGSGTARAYFVDDIRVAWREAVTRPGVPHDLAVARAVGGDGARVEWTPPAMPGHPALDGYQVARRLAGEAWNESHAATTTPSFEEESARFVEREYRVRAHAAAGPGPWTPARGLVADLPYGRADFTFDRHAEGFTPQSEEPESDIRWDAPNGRVHVKADLSGSQRIERFARPVPGGALTPASGAFSVSATWRVSSLGTNIGAYPLYLSGAVTRTPGDVHGAAFVAYQVFEGDDRPAYFLLFRDASGRLRSDDGVYGSASAQYVFNVSYDGASTLTMTMERVGGGRVQTKTYAVGPSDFAFSEMGVSADTYVGAVPVREAVGWVDDVILRRGVDDPPGLPPPVVASAASDAGRVDLAWDAQPDATFYRVYRNASIGYVLLAETAAAAYADVGLPAGASHTYLVSAVSGAGEGQPATLEARTPPRPTPPRDLAATRGPAPDEITFSWRAPTDDGGLPLLAYELARGADVVATPPASATSVTLGGLAENETARFELRALTRAGASDAAAVDARAPSRPWHVERLAATSGPGARNVSLTWDAPADDGGLPIRYRVWLATDEGETLLGETEARAWNATGLAAPAEHTFLVAATNAHGDGPRRAATAVALTAPSAPRDLTVSPGPGRSDLTLAWSTPASDGGAAALRYRVVELVDGTERTRIEGLTATSARMTGLQADTTYTYAVYASNAVTEGPRSETAANATYASARPAAPKLLSAEYDGLFEVRLAWQPGPPPPNAQPTQRWDVERGLEGEAGLVLAWTRVATLGPDARAYVDEPLVPGATYAYRVIAANDWGESFPSAKRTASWI